MLPYDAPHAKTSLSQTPRHPPDPSLSWLIRTELSCASKQQHGGLSPNWGDAGLHEAGMMIMQTWRQSLLYLLVYNFSISHIMLHGCTSAAMFSVYVLFYLSRIRLMICLSYCQCIVYCSVPLKTHQWASPVHWLTFTTMSTNIGVYFESTSHSYLHAVCKPTVY